MPAVIQAHLSEQGIARCGKFQLSFTIFNFILFWNTLRAKGIALYIGPEAMPWICHLSDIDNESRIFACKMPAWFVWITKGLLNVPLSNIHRITCLVTACVFTVEWKFRHSAVLIRYICYCISIYIEHKQVDTCVCSRPLAFAHLIVIFVNALKQFKVRKNLLVVFRMFCLFRIAFSFVYLWGGCFSVFDSFRCTDSPVQDLMPNEKCQVWLLKLKIQDRADHCCKSNSFSFLPKVLTMFYIVKGLVFTVRFFIF